jgi:hypothetical protein
MSDLAIRLRAMQRAYPDRDTSGWDPYEPDIEVDREVAKIRRRQRAAKRAAIRNRPVTRGGRSVKKKNPSSWPAQHPWMTFFLGIIALSTVATIATRQ